MSTDEINVVGYSFYSIIFIHYFEKYTTGQFEL